MSKNTNLRNAKKAKNDEFYTQLFDIEREINHYDNAYFKDKVVLCNCNDGTKSKFWEYFHKNFKVKGLRNLIGISYALQTEDKGRVYIYDGGTTADSDMNLNSCVEVELRGSGDFRDGECLAYLKEADVVVTNPPFSLFREYVAVLMEQNKKFIILGTNNAITYKEFFPLLKDNEVWLGYNSVHEFAQPDGSFKKFGNIGWYTNLDIQKRHENLILYRNYNPEEYPSYDNYNAIEVGKVSEIPCDYEGVMGVPITFLDKYNPDQFEILGINAGRNEFEVRPTKKYINPIQHNKDGTTTNGSKANTRSTLLVNGQFDGIYYTADNTDKPFTTTYARIFIRRKYGVDKRGS